MSEPVVPIVIDLGKKKSKLLKALKRGEGRLVEEVEETLAEVRQNMGAQLGGRELVPVVVVYRKKEKNGGRLRLPLF
jgi:hypothetical protein